jgi:hypothetical protein
MGTRSAWTPERRARQRELIRCSKPWTNSSGPKTAGGKRRSSTNAQAFRGDPEARKAWILIQDLFRTGEMSAELGQIFLAADLSGDLADAIYQDCGHLDED